MDLTDATGIRAVTMEIMPRGRPDPVARHFGEIIQRKRWGLRWTLSDFGRYTGMHPDYLGLLERGLNVPTLNTILRIAEAFGVPAATLIEPVEEYRKKIGLYKGVNR